MLNFKSKFEAEHPGSYRNNLPQLISAYFNCSVNLTGFKKQKNMNCLPLTFVHFNADNHEYQLFAILVWSRAFKKS